MTISQYFFTLSDQTTITFTADSDDEAIREASAYAGEPVCLSEVKRWSLPPLKSSVPEHERQAIARHKHADKVRRQKSLEADRRNREFRKREMRRLAQQGARA